MSAWSGSERARFLRSVSRDAGVCVAIAVVGGEGRSGGGRAMLVEGWEGWRGRWTPLGVHRPSLGLWQCVGYSEIGVFTSGE